MLYKGGLKNVELFDSLPREYSHLYFAKNGKLSACILIEDPMREEAAGVVKNLHNGATIALGLKSMTDLLPVKS